MMRAVRVRLATCQILPEPDPDAAPLDAALAAAGVDATWLAWDDPEAPWDEPVPTVLRSTWNYVRHPDAFAAWLDRVAAAAPVFNPPAVIRGNIHKRYLLDLAGRGVPVVPTALVARGTTPSVQALAASRGWTGRLVVKPAVGAGSFGCQVFAADDHAGAEIHAAAIAAAGDVLIQPYQASVDAHGERSLVWIDGALSHQVRKSPRFAGEVERVTGPYPIADDERAVAMAALAVVADAAAPASLLYGRVDLARDDDDRPIVMELELAEPSLFFALGAEARAVERFVAGLCRRLGATA